MARRMVIGDLRVQQIDRRDGRRSWTIVWPEGTEHAEGDAFFGYRLCFRQNTLSWRMISRVDGFPSACTLGPSQVAR
jgi:hypothetical protein